MTLADQAFDIIWQLLLDRQVDPEVKQSLLDQLELHSQDPARALFEHMADLRARSSQDPATAWGAA